MHAMVLRFFYCCDNTVLVAMSEEQLVANEVQEMGPPGSKALMGESRIGKAPSKGLGPRMSLVTGVTSQVCHTAIFL